MHARITEDNDFDPLDVFFDVGTLILEARVPGLDGNGRGYGEGPHCPVYVGHCHSNSTSVHVCSAEKFHCQRYQNLRKHAFLLWQNAVPLCVEVLVGPECCHGTRRVQQAEVSSTPDPDFLLLERWTVSCTPKREMEGNISSLCLVQAVRSFLHFSQLSAWLNKSNGARPQQLLYRLTMPGQAFTSKFVRNPVEHHFPMAYIGRQRSHIIKVSVSSLPRTDTIPYVPCGKCSRGKLNFRSSSDLDEKSSISRKVTSLGEGLLDPPSGQMPYPLRSRSRSGSPSVKAGDLVFPAGRDSRSPPAPVNNREGQGMGVVDDRMHINCNRSGKHVCTGKDEDVYCLEQRRGLREKTNRNIPTDAIWRKKDVLERNRDTLTREILETRRLNEDVDVTRNSSAYWQRGRTLERRRILDKEKGNRISDRGRMIDPSPVERGRQRRSRKDSFTGATTLDEDKNIQDMANKSSKKVINKVAMENKKNEVARSVPTTDDKLRFQKSLNSAASLVFHANNNGNPATPSVQRFSLKFLRSPPLRMTSSPLLGSFEESLLNGRLEPMSTVEGFHAELGASGSFCPSHELLPVSVFFYSFGGLESDKSASPYLAHVNLGIKGYQVPRRGTVQLTLFNPQGTVVKMFVVLYDLEEMPPNSKTFLRQRTYFMPANETDSSSVAAKWLRYLIHLRFCSSKSGRIYLHTDIRIVVLRKSDVDTASAHIADNSYEWKSFTRGPSNPRFSTR